MPVQRLDESAPPAVALMTRRQYREYLLQQERAEAERAELERSFAEPAAADRPSPRVDVPHTIRLSIDTLAVDTGATDTGAIDALATDTGATDALTSDTPATDALATDGALVTGAAPVGTPLRSRRELREQRAQEEALRVAAERRARAERRATWGGHLPRVGIVGALGLATVVAPVVNGAAKTAMDTASNASDDQVVDDAAAAALAEAGPTPAATTIDALRAASDYRVIPDASGAGAALRVGTGAALTLEQLTASRIQAEAASRDLGRPILPGCEGVVVDTGAANGRLSDSDLCDLWVGGHKLRADAAVALAELNVAYQEAFGEPLIITDSYRSYSAQVSVARRKPGLAARPGTSEHGWGLAVDLAGGVQNADGRYRWLRENAPRFGWDNPAWARSGGSGPYEPWHWEFTAAR